MAFNAMAQTSFFNKQPDNKRQLIIIGLTFKVKAPGVICQFI